jgi:hypothetical protein
LCTHRLSGVLGRSLGILGSCEPPRRLVEATPSILAALRR